MGYGRGLRMKIETDTAEILSGIRFQKTLGSPISLLIRNNDWENWIDKMTAHEKTAEVEKITLPRPGHADLVGVTKYNFDDIRNSIERIKRRKLLPALQACSIARKFLEEFGISIGILSKCWRKFIQKKIFGKLFNNIYLRILRLGFSEESDKMK